MPESPLPSTTSPSPKVTPETLINTMDQQTIPLESTLEPKEQEQVRRHLKEARIPTSRVSRLWHYGTLATGMGLGAINESFRRATGISKSQQGKVIQGPVYCRY
jgi:hypothetical protein